MFECQKDNFVVFGPINTNCKANNTIKINNELINLVGKYKKEDSMKFLGLYIDKHLTWKEHNYKYNQLQNSKNHFCNK